MVLAIVVLQWCTMKPKLDKEESEKNSDEQEEESRGDGISDGER